MATINREWLGSIWKAVDTGQGIEWADFEWYARDRDGSIAMLTSAGPGPVPRSVFRDLDVYVNVVEFFGQLPDKGRAEILIDRPRVDDWMLAAQRGLYGFDYTGRMQPNPVGYHMIARPEEPIHIEEVPEWLREWLMPVTFNQAVFRQSVGTPVNLSGDGVEWL